MRPVVVVVVAVVVAIAFLSPHPVASDPLKPSMVAESLRKKSVGAPRRKTDGALDNAELAINSSGGHKKAVPSSNPLAPKPRLPTRPVPETVSFGLEGLT